MPRLFNSLPIPLGFWPLWSGIALAGAMTLGSACQSPQAMAQPASADPAEPVPNAAPTVSGGRIVRPTLRPGNQGESVQELQSVLVLLGYYPGPVSGVYQEGTLTAVKRFQEAAGLSADGIVGPATWNRLFPTPPAEANPPGTETSSTGNPLPGTPGQTGPGAPAPQPQPEAQPQPTPQPSTPTATSQPVLRPGMEGDAVKQLQQRLQSLGLYSGPIDGLFGSQTESAVRQAQRTNNLTVDGIVGPATWAVLNK